MAGEINVRNPRTGAIDFTFTGATEADVAAAAVRLRAGQKRWAAAGLEHRIGVMQRWAESLKLHAAAITAADSEDTGYGQVSRIAVDMIIGVVRATCSTAPMLMQNAVRSGASPAFPDVRYDVLLKPLGLVGVISPWNAPTMLSMMRSIAPLVAGCAVLVKPSEVTPRFVAPLRASIAEVPELAGVFDFILGAGNAGAALVENADLINFCGSVATGRRVAEGCARRLIPCELELGGKDPLVITASADLDDAVSAAVRGALTSSGQVCFSIERVYVQRSVHDDFVARLAARCARVRINHPDPMVGELGPFIAGAQPGIVDRQLADAVTKGARIVTGGPSFELDGGLYMNPTIVTGVSHDMALMREETFGPVIPIMAFDTVDEAVALANDTDFGLSAAVMAGSEDEARAIAGRIDAGNVSLQDAFLTFAAAPAEADSFGASGIGGRRSGILRYMKRQAVLLNTAKPACLTDRRLSAVA